MRGRYKFGVVGLAVAAVLALVVACAPAAAPPPGAAVPEEVEMIPIGLNMGLTGAVASCTYPQSLAGLDYFQAINDAGGFEYTGPDGKVHKAKWDIMWADNAFSVAKSISIVNRFYEKGARVFIVA
ncbi:MAG TPA: hypothetical protein G4O12_03755 [Dehalococcoidia bacterium]|nr:hypothetical protein [Dehalococcoidia bacterium]